MDALAAKSGAALGRTRRRITDAPHDVGISELVRHEPGVMAAGAEEGRSDGVAVGRGHLGNPLQDRRFLGIDSGTEESGRRSVPQFGRYCRTEGINPMIPIQMYFAQP